jgi:NADH dehydrogenase
MSVNALFITGATGFVGRSLLRRLVETGSSVEEVYCLVRPGRRPPDPSPKARFDLRIVSGSLDAPASYESALERCDTVVHLAAATGKASPDEYFRVNTEGTRSLLQASRRTAPQFLFVSTIAARYADKTSYHYARSKEEAEALVRTSGLRYTIARPTIVLGPGSPIGRMLGALGSSPFIPLPGNGQCRVQPIHVDDLADVLIAIAERGMRHEEIEIGGPEVSTLESLVARVRPVAGKPQPRVVHLPLRPLVGLLGTLEKVIPSLLPVTAGQLSLFSNDGAARPDPFVNDRLPRFRGIDDMLRTHGARA